MKKSKDFLENVYFYQHSYIVFGGSIIELFVFFDRLEITSRMAPQAIFKAWKPLFNEDTSSTVYNYDEQSVTVNLEDRTLVRQDICILFEE